MENLATHNATGVTHAEMEQTIRDAYRIMMNRLKKMGTKLGGIEYLQYVSDCGCSEGDGYGLLAAASMADKPTFDGLWLWIHDNPMNKVTRYSTGQAAPAYLYSTLPGYQHAAGGNSATDGDVDIALALYIAYCQWGEFMGINDSKGNPISYKHDCIEFLKGLTDTFSFTPQSDKPLLSGDIGLDGYVKGGDTWGELTSWAANPTVTGLGKPPYQTSATKQHIDYNAPAYFHEFADFLSKEDSAAFAWNIFQFRRAEASSDWLMGQFLQNPSMIPVAGWVEMSATNVVTMSRYMEGEDFRLPWRTVLNPLWHGKPSSTWDPETHLVKNQVANSYEEDIGKRFAKFLWDTRQSPWNQPCVLGADKLFSYWGPAVTYSGYTLTGGQDGATTGFFLNWIPGSASPSAVISQDFNLMAEFYRYLEIEWFNAEDGDGYLTSVPFYFHDIFRLIGLLTLSGNYHSPSSFKPGANMKVYMAINKTFGFDKDSVTYTIDYRNYGSLDAQNVTVTDTLHKDFVFLSATGGGVYSGASNTVTWNIGTVPGFKTATGIAPTKGQVKLVVKVGNATQKQYRNRATISCSNGTGWTSNEYPNNISSVMERNYLDIAKRALIIKQSATTPLVKAGDLVQFIIDFENSSEAGWINGGRPGVHFSYSQTPTANKQQNVMRFRLFHDANEAYLDYNNYRVSYFLFDEENTCVKDPQSTGCPTGWQITKSIIEPTALTNTIKLLQENIMPGSDTLGKWNQRLVIQFSDPSNSQTVPNLVTIDHHLSQYRGMRGRIHRGGIDPLRLVWIINSSTWTAVDWSQAWSWDAKSDDPKGDAGVYFPVTNDWTDPENPDIPVKNWNRKSCETATHTVDNILVEEWDGYTWRRVAGNGPVPGRDVSNVTIRDTIPAGFTFKEFVGSSPLGVSPKITGNVITWSIPKMQIKQKGTIAFTATASCQTGQIQPMRVVNRSWISADKESPFSDSVAVKIICDPNYVEIPPTKSTMALKGPNLETIGDTARIDTTSFHVVVTDKDQDQNGKARDTVSAWITNPSGSDSIFVKLIETGEATGIFQTASPVAVVSGPSGSSKMHMNPGDAVWATYTDPVDSTDVSQACLITIASFPMPIRGWLLDANGDGCVDSAAVVYNKAIDSPPDSLRFNFPDPAGSRTLSGAALRILGNTLAASFAPPFPKNVTAFTTTPQGSAAAYLTDGGIFRRIVFPLIDSAGPVITAAQAVERADPNGVDTLFVTFSEALQAASLKGASLILVKSTGPVVITVDSARQLLSNRFAVSLAAATPRPLPGDSLRINPAGPIRDLPGNAAHTLNPPVLITVKQIAPSIVDAWYVDRDAHGADGMVDTAIVRFNKKVSLSDLSFLLDWGSGLTGGDIKGDALAFAGSDSIVAIALQPSFPYAKYVRTSGAMMATASFASFPGESNNRQVKDSAAPVIDNATFIPDASLNELCDTLEVTFSEPANVGSGLKPFEFSGRTGISYEYDLSVISSKDNKFRFCIKFASDRAPRAGDSICINPNSSVSDVQGTFQNNRLNRKVALRIMPAPPRLGIIVLKNPFYPKAPLDSLGIRGAAGTAIVIISTKKNASLPDITSATIKIYDAVGNCVHDDRFSPQNITSDGGGYYFVWDGYNTKRRAVGAGVYVAVITASESGGVPVTKRIRIGVKRR